MSNEPEADDDCQVFELGLSEGGDEGSGFRTQNDPRAPIQRTNITERKGAIDIRCTAADVVHGFMKDGEEPATLIVHEFQFDPRKRARRIASVDISFTYASHDGREPQVVQIAPRGRMTLVPTSQSETITHGSGANIGGSVLGADLGGSYTWQRAVTRETKDATTIVGTIDLVGRNYGDSNAASWTLMENQSVETGVPAHFRTAILLSRKDDGEFFSTFNIKARVDLVSRFTKLIGSKPKDDPILYDPTRPPTNRLRDYDVDNLGAVNLQDLSVVAFANENTQDAGHS